MHVPLAGRRHAELPRLHAADGGARPEHRPGPHAVPDAVKNGATINYQAANIGTNDTYGFSSAFGDPKTPVLRAYVGDKAVVHALVPAGTEQTHVVHLGGQSFDLDQIVSNSTMISTIAVGPMEKFDATDQRRRLRLSSPVTTSTATSAARWCRPARGV